MKKNNLIPVLAKNITFHEFSKTDFLVHESVNDHRLRISKNTYELLQLIDGEKSLEKIKKLLNYPCTIEELFDILYINFGRYGIIKSDFTSLKVKTSPNYLKLSFILLPSHIVSMITPYFTFLFRNKTMHIVLLMSTLVIGYSLYNNFTEIANQNFEFKYWILLLSFGFISVMFHELGHVTAADYYGAKNGGVGGGFYLFTPVFFADVSDIWKLSPKKRIVVNLAGIYFETIICAILCLFGVLIDQKILLIMGLLIFINSLFNLNPFIRNDGYWVVTDLADISNLFKTSREKLSLLLKSIFNKNIDFIFSFKSIMLALYAAASYFFICAFVYYALFIDGRSVLLLPYNLYVFLESLILGTNHFSLNSFTPFLIPILFYYFLFKYLIGIVKKRKFKKMALKKKSLE